MIRPAAPLDAGPTAAILSAFTDDTPWMPRIHSRAQDLAHMGDLIDRGWVHVLQADGVAGFIACDGAVIHALYVDAAARGAGLGKALLDHAKAGADRLTLWTYAANADAQRFYRREGFAETARTDGRGNDEGLPDIAFTWERTAP